MSTCPHIGRRFAQKNGWRCSNCGEVEPYTDDDPAPSNSRTAAHEPRDKSS